MRNGQHKDKSLWRILRRNVTFSSHLDIFLPHSTIFFAAQVARQIHKIKLNFNLIDVLKCDVIWDTNIRILDYHKRMTTYITNIIILITSMPSFGFKIYYRLDRFDVIRIHRPSRSEVYSFSFKIRLTLDLLTPLTDAISLTKWPHALNFFTKSRVS